MKKTLVTAAGTALLLSVSTTSSALPDSNTHGFIYYAALHEAGLYNGAEFYRRDFPNRDLWADGTLQKITHARYNAIDNPMVEATNEALTKLANDEGLSIKYKNVYTSGTLTTNFTPSSKPNTLNFTINGINLTGYAKVEKSWYAEGTIRANINNINITGEYDYFNGVVNVTDFHAPLTADVDVDLSIPIIGDILDPLVDSIVDDKINSQLPADLNYLYNGGDAFSLSFFGVKEYIPLNELMFQGIDYGQVIRDKLAKETIINDNFSFSVGNIVVHKQSLAVTIGNLTYKRWTTGGKRVCTLDGNPDCTPY
ncbi:hypothetical protein [Thalassomonas sp. RHCl1]|uniref:hypothetical protein n=1 Tax=Thalassomonas sp. RHCl1 TaxID=2995320 RepID=UPI00248CD259|nr:hypothetical protein [Thalassomonas sp. RHCl1]